MQQAGEHEPFIDEILRTLHRITVDLAPQQVSKVTSRGVADRQYQRWRAAG